MAKIKDLLRKLRETNPELAKELSVNPDKDYVSKRLQELTGHLIIDLRTHNKELRKNVR